METQVQVAANVVSDEVSQGLPSLFGRNLRVIMAYRNVNSTDLAIAAGLTQVGISNILCGRVRQPRLSSAQKLATALQVKTSDFYKEDLVTL